MCHDIVLMNIVGAAVMACALSSPAAAQDRLPPIPADQLSAAQRQAVEAFKAARDVEISGPFVPLLRSPEVMTRARAMGDYLRFKSALPPRLSEFVILLTARRWTQQYEWFAHYRLALDAGVKPDVVAAIADGQRPPSLSTEEAALYDFVEQLQPDRRVSDALYARMRELFGEQGIIDTIGIVGYYSMLSMVMNTAQTAVPASTVPALKAPRGSGRE